MALTKTAAARKPFFIFCHQQLHPQKKEGEEDGYLVKVVEENIKIHPAGKGVEEGSQHSIAGISDKAAEVEKGRGRGTGRFQNQQRGHEMGQSGCGKEKSQPKKGAKEEVEAVGADEVHPKVGVPVPVPVSAADGLVGQLIEGDLLDVKIPIINKVALIKNKEGDKNHHSCNKSVKKGSPRAGTNFYFLR